MSRPNATSIVYPQLEYASTVWDPVTKSNIAKVESVQRHAARFCFNDYPPTSSVTSMLQELGWEDLQSRQEQNKVAMMYRVIYNYSWYNIVPSTPTRDPFSCLQSVNSCPPVPYQHQLWMTSRDLGTTRHIANSAHDKLGP